MAKTTKSQWNDGLKKIGPGKWLARVVGPRDENGKRTIDTERTIEADTKMQALQKRQKLYDELIGCDSEWLVNEAIKEWLPTLHAGSRPGRTTHATSFAKKFGSRRLSTVQPMEIQRWLVELTCTDTTASYYRASIAALYRYAKRQGRLLGANPVPETELRVTPKSNAERLAALNAPTKRSALIGDALPKFFAALLSGQPALFPMAKLQLLIGCRWGEAAALQWSDIDWGTGAVHIRRSVTQKGVLSPPKNGKSRFAALGPEGIAFMRGHCADMERKKFPGWELWVFPRPETGKPRAHDMWPYTTVWGAIRKAQEDAGIDLDKATHAFRHTHVTLSRALHSDEVMRLSVGHAGEEMTEDYTDDTHRVAEVVSLAGAFEARLQNAGGGFGGVGSKTSPKSLEK